ncbi:nephrin-like [Penaeus vannamei]|uniref:nephrin-like n=1 Tax=Penaeus vannamei TaxID=6689 RepID=UPI00387FA429
MNQSNGSFADVWCLRQSFVVTPESVEVRSGADVFLPCVVKHQQGNAQWTKDGFALGFDRDVPGYPRYRYAGDAAKGEHHLVIKGVTLQDDGEYQCQVGPTANASAIWAAANLTVLVSPGSISIGDVGDGEKLEVKAGQRLTLDCVVRDARPAPSVTWYRSGLRLDSALHEEEVFRSSQGRRWSVRSSLKLLPSSDDDERQFSCRALHPALEGSPTSLVASVVLSVLHPPRLPEILGYKTGEVLLEGERRLLTCMVDSGNPRPVVEWQRHGRPTGMVHDDPGGKTTLTPSAGYFYDHQEGSRMLNVTQEVTATRQEDRAVYECRVYSKLLPQPLSANVTLTVQYPPEDVTLYGPLTVAPGQVFSITCITSPANPPAEINWMIQVKCICTRIPKGEYALADDFTNSVPSKVTEDAEGGWVTSSDLTSEYVSLVNVSEVALACRSHNPASDWVVSESRVITVTIGVINGPDPATITRSKDTRNTNGKKGRMHTRTSTLCAANTANFSGVFKEPPGRPLLTLEAADGSDDPIVGFDEANRHEGMGKEEGKEEEQGDAGEEGPESAQVMRAVAGRTLKVECSSDGGNPPPTITWVLITDSCPGGFGEQQKAYFISCRLYMNREKIFANLTQVGKTTRAQAEIEVKSTDKDSEVVCEVTNPATTAPLTARITLVVLFPPLEAHSWVTPDTVEEGSKVTLVCQTSSSFPASNITWHSEGDELGTGLITRSQAAYGGTVTREYRCVIDSCMKVSESLKV